MSYQDLRDKTIIVTGAASGIGRATAIELARQGAQIGLLDLKQCDEVVREIVEAGGKAIAFVVDVADSAAVRHSMRQTAEHFGKISGAANLAGWVGSQRWSENGFSLHAIEDADWDAMIATNLTGVKNCVKAELENFHEDGGSIVNASSIAGQRGTKNNSPYGASKAAVIALSKAAAQETGSRQIRVNAIVP